MQFVEEHLRGKDLMLWTAANRKRSSRNQMLTPAGWEERIKMIVVFIFFLTNLLGVGWGDCHYSNLSNVFCVLFCF